VPETITHGEIAFDRYVVRPSARQVLVDGQPAKLSGRAFDLLLTVIEHRDRVVSKNELLDLVWPGLEVEENNLQVHVSALRKLLGPNAISTIPGRGYRFTASVTQAAPDPPPTLAASAAPQFQQTLFGRDEDLVALAKLVADHRLVTIVGAGGIGKTALALGLLRVLAGTQTSADRAGFAGGAWVVDLAPLKDAGQVAPAIASALQVALGAGAANTALAKAIKDRQVMILLDNCEHLVHSVAAVADELLRAAPQLHLLATSQQPLKLAEEQIYRVSTLSLPKRVTLIEARKAGAVRLFESRAQAADIRFVLNERNVEAVVDICKQLDGMALAIELAAARVQLLGAQGVRERLGQRLFMLSSSSRTAPPRHRTLRAALDWSHALLSPPQQAVFRRLGVMSGPFGLEASQQIAGNEDLDEWAVLDHLGALVDKSLIAVEPNTGGEIRYRLLETMRQFALERLIESGEEHATRERHLAHFLALAERAKLPLAGAAQGEWLIRLDLDRDNFFAAHAWCDHAELGTERGLKLVNALMRYWLSRGLMWQGYRAYVTALARPHIDVERHELHKQLRCEALLHAGVLCSYRGVDIEARALLQESASIARDAGLNALLSNVLSRLGFVNLSLHDRAAARACLEESLAVARQLAGEPSLLSQAASSLGELERVEGRLGAAKALYEESLRNARAIGDKLRMMIVLNNLSMVAVATEDANGARRMMIESLTISDELGSRRGRLVVMEVAAGLASHLQQWPLAASFDGAAGIHTVQMGRRRDIADAAFLAPFVERARLALGDAMFMAAQAAGRAWSYDDAVAKMTTWLEEQ
jgi:predicted ATPase